MSTWRRRWIIGMVRLRRPMTKRITGGRRGKMLMMTAFRRKGGGGARETKMMKRTVGAEVENVTVSVTRGRSVTEVVVGMEREKEKGIGEGVRKRGIEIRKKKGRGETEIRREIEKEKEKEKGKGREKGLGGAVVTRDLNVIERRNCSAIERENLNQERADGLFAHTNGLTMRNHGFIEESGFPQFELHKVCNAYGILSVFQVFVPCEDIIALTSY